MRAIFDVWQTTQSAVAKGALDRIAQFYAIEDKARFAPPDERRAPRAATIPLARCVLHRGAGRRA
jgi:transposase